MVASRQIRRNANLANVRGQKHFAHEVAQYWLRCEGLQLRRPTLADYFILAVKMGYAYLGTSVYSGGRTVCQPHTIPETAKLSEAHWKDLKAQREDEPGRGVIC